MQEQLSESPTLEIARTCPLRKFVQGTLFKCILLYMKLHVLKAGSDNFGDNTTKRALRMKIQTGVCGYAPNQDNPPPKWMIPVGVPSNQPRLFLATCLALGALQDLHAFGCLDAGAARELWPQRPHPDLGVRQPHLVPAPGTQNGQLWWRDSLNLPQKSGDSLDLTCLEG